MKKGNEMEELLRYLVEDCNMDGIYFENEDNTGIVEVNTSIYEDILELLDNETKYKKEMETLYYLLKEENEASIKTVYFEVDNFYENRGERASFSQKGFLAS